MTRSMGMALALVWLGASVAACSSARDVPYTEFQPERRGDGYWPPGSTDFPPVEPRVDVNRDKELLVTNRSVLDGARSDGTVATAPWSFRHLVESLAAPLDASAFVRTWLASWESSFTPGIKGGLPLGLRPDVRSELLCPWLKLTPANECDETCSTCTAENLDLSRAPFRLLAIVNRLDLAETTNGCSPELSEIRFVFAALRPGASTPINFNVIFEYGANETAAGEPKTWHALAPLDGEAYAKALEQLTRAATDRNDPPLKQLRTSENLGAARETSWELRQFERVDGWLVPSPLTNTARDALDGTTELADHVDAHFDEIASGNNAITAAFRTAVSTMPRADFRWSDANGPSPASSMLDLFGLSTCNGCHAGHRGDTTILPFAHIGANDKGETILSRFLVDPLNPEGDELAFRSRSLQRRILGLCGSPEASYAGRRGGPRGLEKLPSLARVH